MSKLGKITSIEFDQNKTRVFGIKSAILWAHEGSGSSYPLLYISKPKHVSQEDYDRVISKLDINVKVV